MTPKDNEDSKKLESFNEDILKSTAVTFSLEGINKDLGSYIQKKITFNNRSIKHLTDLVRCLAESENTELVNNFLSSGSKNKKSSLNKLMDHLTDEIEATNSLINFVIQRIIESENSLNSDVK